MPLPGDANMLLSYVNLKLRDFYPDLDTMCDDLDGNRELIEEKLKKIGYIYDSDQNQFI